MFQTRVTEMLGIQYPIIQGGLQWLARAELAAAVSNAGGLGIINSATFPTKEGLRDEIRQAKSLTDKPFGVNVNLFPTTRPVNTEEYIDTLISEGVRAVETSGRSPEPYMRQLKEGGVKVIHKCTAVRYALTVQRIGADAVALVGFEGAGHPGMDDVTSLILIPLAADALKIPVIAAGGFADARGFVAALALGAEGVLMGTRFVMTRECLAHPKIKETLLNAKETDTVMIERSIRNAARVFRNPLAEKVLEMEAQGATLEVLLPYISGERGRRALLEGDANDGSISIGQVIGLIHDLPTVQEVIDSIISGAIALRQRLYPD